MLKWSRYNVTVADGDQLLLFNTLTGCLVSLESGSSDRAFYEHNRSRPVDEAENDAASQPFLQLGFLVPETLDEMNLVKARNQIARFSNDDMFLSILLGLDCNLRCTYCFEEHRNERMGEDTVKRVVAFVSSAAKRYRSVHVDWFGGEPLLHVRKIVDLSHEFSRICETAGAEYSESMTTNGYLLNETTLRELQTTRISKYQITLDGPPEVHDKLRPLADGRGTYATIARNIAMLPKQDQVYLRINVLPETIERVPELLESLKSAGVDRVHLSVKAVVPSVAGLQEISEFHPEEFARKLVGVYRLALGLGFDIYPGDSPLTASMYCPVDSIGQFLIGPDGKLFKCGERFGIDEAVGYIDPTGDAVLDEQRWSQWIGKDSTPDEECRECRVLPLCYGGCSMKRLWKGSDWCLPMRYNVEDYVRLIYEAKTRKSLRESVPAS